MQHRNLNLWVNGLKGVIINNMSFSFKFFREERVLDEVKIALVGKYTKLEDAYISVLKALKHASLHCNRSLKVVVGSCFVYSAVLVRFSVLAIPALKNLDKH